ncbi:MAG: hypothetical protein J2O48_05050 [Solirubrobacterales bacterium]|nr:hypothetical protein [Solirubrobacterales bacterium]
MLTTQPKAIATLAAAVAALAITPADSSAAVTEGTQIPTFGTNGWTTTQIGTWSAAVAAAEQPNGDIVTVGEAKENGKYELVSSRYTPTGQLDPSYGTGGVASIPIGGAASGNALKILPNGDIVLTGAGESATGQLEYATAELTPNGQLDPSFGNNGVSLVPVGGAAMANGIVAQSDGKLVIAGGASQAGKKYFAATRLNPNGSVDTSYGTNGTAEITSDQGEAWNEVLQPNGDIVLGGQQLGSNVDRFMAARLTPDGKLDPSFGNAGVSTVGIGDWAEADAIALQPDGDIVLSGDSKSLTQHDVSVARLTPNGALDPSFGSKGIAKTPGGGANAVALQNDGKIDVAGVGAGVIRFTPNGQLDTGFGHNGWQMVADNKASTSANGIIQGHNGELILSGATTVNKSPVLALTELNP